MNCLLPLLFKCPHGWQGFHSNFQYSDKRQLRSLTGTRRTLPPLKANIQVYLTRVAEFTTYRQALIAGTNGFQYATAMS